MKTFEQKLDKFVERGADKVPSALLDFKECTCEDPEWGQCQYHDKDYDVVFGYNNCAESLKPIVLKLYEAIEWYANQVNMTCSTNECCETAEKALAEIEEMLNAK